MGFAGGLEVNVMACALSGAAAAGPLTMRVCCTCGAALKRELPAWFRSIVHRPATTNSAVPRDNEHEPFELRSMETTTGFPEPPPVAPIVYVPPTVGLLGGVVQTEIFCGVSREPYPKEIRQN